MSLALVDNQERLPLMRPRVLTLGESFILELAKVPRGRGLMAAYEQIQKVFGDTVGVRNTFAKLQYVDSYANLRDKDRWRAWILMSVLGMNPDDFGASDAIVPPVLNIVELRTALKLPDMDSNHEPTHSSLAPVSSLSDHRAGRGERESVDRGAGDRDAIVSQLATA